MVAYSFQKRFVEPILSRSKRHTIRAHRKRHARPGEPLQLYAGMRTRQCRLIGRARALGVSPIAIDLAAGLVTLPGQIISGSALEAFAQSDGFTGWPAMVAFWNENHPNVARFEGVLILWGDSLEPAR